MTCWVKQNKWLFLKVHDLHQKLIPALLTPSQKNYVIKSQRKKAQQGNQPLYINHSVLANKKMFSGCTL